MTRLSIRRGALALLAVCCTLFLPASLLLAQDPAPLTPAPIAVTFGPGPFNLLRPASGLADLAAYRATLTLSFEGTSDGQPDQWSRTYQMLAGNESAGRQLIVETANDPAARLFMLESNGVTFERRGEDDCTASVTQPGNTLAEVWEPARFLFGVIGADESGAETVNGVAANHYTFDEQALGARDVAAATGELWVDPDGGTLVRYLLEMTGGGAAFGPGTEGTIRWDYELTDANQPLSIEVPADCPAGLLDLPLLPDATAIVRQPGMTTYTTLASPADAAAFYEEQLTSAGAEASFPPSVSDALALLEFTQGDTLTSVIASAGDGVTQVMVTAGSNTPPADAEAVEAPTSITVQVEGGGTVDIPLLPDATDVAGMQGIATYFSATPPPDVATFYQERLLALGGQIYTPLNTFAGVSVMEIVLGDYLLAINIRAEGGGGSSLFIRVDPPGTFTPITAPLVPTQAVAVPEQPAADCAAGSGGMPILPDATDRVEAPGITSYNTATSVTDAAAFYTEQIEAAGGQVFSAMPVSDAMAMLQFTMDSQAGSVMIMATGGVNSVVISAVSGMFGQPAANCDAASIPAGGDTGTSSDTETAACTISSASSANQRSGPGTNFALVGTLAGGTSAPVLGQATGADGFVWWQLAEGVWVRSDVVTQAGSCDDVPTIQP